jgi:hypothetical protein
MNNDIVSILYNPSAIHTPDVNSEDMTSFREEAQQQALDKALERDYQLLETLDELVCAEQPALVDGKLIELKELLVQGIPSGIGKAFLQEFNSFLQRATQTYTQSRSLFQQCLELVIQVKKIMDGRSHIIRKGEWIQLEKALHFLTLWEAGIMHQHDQLAG